MIRRFVRAVIHNATVTETDAAPPACVRLDPILMRAAEVLPLEEVEVVNLGTGRRFTTWVEAGVEGSGEVRVHAGTEHHVRRGDIVSIISHGLLHDGQTLNHKAKVITVDAKNRILSLSRA
jgi:aspartate 1-decarboxylase